MRCTLTDADAVAVTALDDVVVCEEECVDDFEDVWEVTWVLDLEFDLDVDFEVVLGAVECVDEVIFEVECFGVVLLCFIDEVVEDNLAWVEVE